MYVETYGNVKLKLNNFFFPTCVLLSCLSLQVVCYFLLSYDGQRKGIFILKGTAKAPDVDPMRLDVLGDTKTAFLTPKSYDITLIFLHRSSP